MKQIVILDAKTLGEDLDLTPLDGFGKVSTYQTTRPDETLDRIKTAEIIITNKVLITAQMMEEAPQLKLICIAATGMNNVDLDAAKTMGIEVKNVAGYSTKSVVQHTFTMAFYLIEKMAYYDQTVKSGVWSKSGLFTDVSKPFFEIAEKKWGIIGLGTIGQEVARVATAFGANVCYYSTSGENYGQKYPHMALEKLLQECEIISVHCPLNDKTQNLINASNLGLLKEGTVLLNLGRGGIINETDLAMELDKKEIYAGLDVLMPEPISEDNPLMYIKYPGRLLITPHIAWASIEARQKLLDGIVKNIQSFLEGQK
ncbi:MAG: 2-hydroxyacid dehydrogenase [Epsilonproteobacteria bacterium (ex Lamellibrachia satsuma)]|nr:MAG: 2-hydroxyacid dehydrogenase [Epsilonproteobacteria bacterium (ex Lamellibrachia satsuma)]